MENDPSDSSGTDDDLPPPHQNRLARGNRVTGNGRTPIVGALPYNARAHIDMETQIHQLEQEAYCSVLHAFKAQSDAITWEKESLITELRKELRVSDEEHRELLGRVNADDIIQRLREWRQAGGGQLGLLSTSQAAHDAIPSPTVSASRKKQKTSQTVPPSLSLGAPLPSMLPPSVARRGAVVGARGKKPKSSQAISGSLNYPSTGAVGTGQAAIRGQFGANEPMEASLFDPLVGRKVMTRWPEDNNFYEAVISDYDPVRDRHALVYDMNKTNETWEWVNLKEIPSEDIRWEGEDPGISRRGGRGGPGRGIKKFMGRGNAIQGIGRGRGAQSKKDFPPLQNGVGKKNADDIEILHTDTLINKVERVFSSSNPDPQEIDKAKKVLKEHEQALVDAIDRLAEASDGESGGLPFSHGQPTDKDLAWVNQQYGGGIQHRDFEDDVGGGRGDGLEELMATDARGRGSDDHHNGHEADEDSQTP